VVLGGWGQSEDALVTLGIPGDPDDKIIDTDGSPWPGMRIRVVDEISRELPPGMEGRLQVTGPFLFVGYAERLSMTRESFDGEWFDTGDLANIDVDGYLRISGRTKDVIIRGGENIPVAYVENVLYEHPDITAVAVVGMPDPRLQERACAFVVLVAGAELTLADMQRFFAGKGVAKQYWPERLEVLPELPAPPAGRSKSSGCARRCPMPEAFLVDGVRTPIGRHGGALAAPKGGARRNARPASSLSTYAPNAPTTPTSKRCSATCATSSVSRSPPDPPRCPTCPPKPRSAATTRPCGPRAGPATSC
jgi:hypothetical protein